MESTDTCESGTSQYDMAGQSHITTDLSANPNLDITNANSSTASNLVNISRNLARHPITPHTTDASEVTNTSTYIITDTARAREDEQRQQSPINKLAPELRAMVYEQLVGRGRQFRLAGNWKWAQDRNRSDWSETEVYAGNALSILQTCRAIRKEALPHFFGRNTSAIQLHFNRLFDWTDDSDLSLEQARQAALLLGDGDIPRCMSTKRKEDEPELLYPHCLEFRVTGPPFTNLHVRTLVQCFAHLCVSGLDQACIKIRCPRIFEDVTDSKSRELGFQKLVALGYELAQGTCTCGKDDYDVFWAGEIKSGKEHPRYQCHFHVGQAFDRLVFCKEEIAVHARTFVNDWRYRRFQALKGLHCHKGPHCCKFDGNSVVWIKSAMATRE